MSRYLLALDQGTTSSRAILFDRETGIAGADRGVRAAKDKAMLPWVQKFSSCGLYSKGHAKPKLEELKPFYDELFAEFLPGKLDW